MPACTFFGHGECPDLRYQLHDVIAKLAARGVDMFYVGNQGGLDAQVRDVLRDVDVRYAVVLAYLPNASADGSDDTMFPKGLELVHPRYAIDRRNQWMLDHSDYVVTYVRHGWGGAAKFAAIAEHRGKTVIKL